MSPHADYVGWADDPDFQDWLNELLVNAGDEWDSDEAMTSIAVRYVRHLESLAEFVKKVAEYSNDGWLAREALSHIGSKGTP